MGELTHRRKNTYYLLNVVGCITALFARFNHHKGVLVIHRRKPGVLCVELIAQNKSECLAHLRNNMGSSKKFSTKKGANFLAPYP